MSTTSPLNLKNIITAVTKIAIDKGIDPKKVMIVDISKFSPGTMMSDLKIDFIKSFIDDSYECKITWVSEKKPLSFI